jgi:TldD protein
VIDDPTQERIGGQLVMGHYKYDDQGVKVAPLPLVEKGQLQAQVMSRNPSKKCKQSNGHGRGVYRPSASTGCLIVTSTDPLDEKELKAKLLEKCENEDLEYGLRIAALGSGGGGGGGGRYARYFSMMNFGGDFGGRGGLTPLAMYKVFRDGREELVRGAQVARLDLKAFKRLLAAGDKPYVRNTGGMESQTTIVPALLFEELDLAKIDRDFDKPPQLPNPLARGDARSPPK